MVDDLPGDVRSVLTQLFEEGATAIEADDCETARRTVETARTVSLNKLPAGDLRAQLLHGCDRAAAALDPADGTEPVVATEYLRAMASRVERTDQ